MSYSTYKSSRDRRGGYQGNQNSGRSFAPRSFSPRGARRIKSFDPRLLVNKAIENTVAEVYQPTHAFADFAIDQRLKEIIITRGYTQPTPIQDQAIPHLLQNKDVIGIANTGTGKTAAFLIPILDKLLRDNRQNALIVVPTRELAVQIQEEQRIFSQGLPLRSLLCIGGTNMYRQIEGLRRQPNIVIGTPGRLKDLINRGKLHLEDFSTFVLDEVDRMLDMGFIHDVKFLISHLPRERQSLSFSATMSSSVRAIVDSLLIDPVSITVKSQETALNVDQDVIRTDGKDKIDVLHDLLLQKEMQKVIVFGRTKHGIEKLNTQLENRGFSVVALHGNKRQSQRQKALSLFRQNKVTILLATDVAARGLDIADVTHVINFDLPETYEEYVHRIGRTGRANKKGIALSFV